MSAWESTARSVVDEMATSSVAFARKGLGFEPWDDGSGSSQADVLRACDRYQRLAVKSGHKTGKTDDIAVYCLKRFVTRPGSRTIVLAPTARQVREAPWNAITRLYRNSKFPIGGKLHKQPITGLVGPDGTQVLGFSADDPDNLSGLSCPDMAIIFDEAAGLEKGMSEAIEGMAAGGAQLVYFGNPTQTSGPFFDCFHKDRALWHTMHISSEQAARHNSSRPVPVRGLATLDWIDQMRTAWGGIDDPRYQVRVEGNFPSSLATGVVPLKLVLDAIARWRDAARGNEGAQLYVGVDVARYGDDETVFVAKRGTWVSRPKVLRGLNGSAVAKELHAFVRDECGGMPQGNDRPVVRVDEIGVGAAVVDALYRDYSRVFQIEPINVAGSAHMNHDYANLRTEMAFGLRDYLREGGVCPNDDLLRDEIVSLEYAFDERGRFKMVSKDKQRELLGRSPDRADAFALAVLRFGSVTGQGIRAPAI